MTLQEYAQYIIKEGTVKPLKVHDASMHGAQWTVLEESPNYYLAYLEDPTKVQNLSKQVYTPVSEWEFIANMATMRDLNKYSELRAYVRYDNIFIEGKVKR